MLRKLKVLSFIIFSLFIFGFTPKGNKFCSTQVVVRNYTNVTIKRIQIYNTSIPSGYDDFSVSIPPGGSFTAPPNNAGNYAVIVDFSAPVVRGIWRIIYAKSQSSMTTIASGTITNSTRVQGNALLSDGCSYYYFDVLLT